jgi:hypothetical protein
MWPAAFVITSLASSLRAEAQNSPPSAPDQQELPSSAPDQQELPPPYDAWASTGPAPPPARPVSDLPPPLARPRELPRRPFELSASLAAFLPSCGSGSIDDRGCLTVAPGSGIDATLLYRVGPFFAFGVEGAASGFAARGHGALSGAGGGARFFGVSGRVYFSEHGRWDPYLALTLGTGTLALSGAEGARVSTSGLGGRVAGGIDMVLGSHFRVGPSASFAHWVAWSEASCSNGVCRDEPALYGRMLGFATLGVRLTGSFGEVL